MINVKMYPMPGKGQSGSGIETVINKWIALGSEYGLHFIDHEMETKYDIMAIHSGAFTDIPKDYRPIVSHLHGLYWTGDNKRSPTWQHLSNKAIAKVMRHSMIVTVPSPWVADAVRREFRIEPEILRHGIDVDEWAHNEKNVGYVLWNKNRNTDACNPGWMQDLASKTPSVQFISTFGMAASNVITVGSMPFSDMKPLVQRAGVYLATAKETFGVGTLEAMASGVPVLGFRWGHTGKLVQHGINGYLVEPGDMEGLSRGLSYCMMHRATLAANGRKLAKKYVWSDVMNQLQMIYSKAKQREYGATIIIPCFNYGQFLTHAVESCLKQTARNVEIIIVDNNSTDDTAAIGMALCEKYDNVIYTNCVEQGVAHARNYGIALANYDYVMCLDADDAIHPQFVDACLSILNVEHNIGIVYSQIRTMSRDGELSQTVSSWPPQYDYDMFLSGQNQIPTCAMFRRDLWQRAGGYKQRYAPRGAGSEDAEFFLRLGEMGYAGRRLDQPYFYYRVGGSTSMDGYSEVPWDDKPWKVSGHRLSSLATPDNGTSHEPRQWDRANVTIVIPVGDGHERLLIDALDSIEAQIYDNWNVVVVDDRRTNTCLDMGSEAVVPGFDARLADLPAPANTSDRVRFEVRGHVRHRQPPSPAGNQQRTANRRPTPRPDAPQSPHTHLRPCRSGYRHAPNGERYDAPPRQVQQARGSDIPAPSSFRDATART